MRAGTKCMEAVNAFKHRIARIGQRGVTTVEYAVMLVLVAIVVLSFGAYFGDSVKNTFSRLVVAMSGSESGDDGSGSGSSGDSASTGTGDSSGGGGSGGTGGGSGSNPSGGSGGGSGSNPSGGNGGGNGNGNG